MLNLADSQPLLHFAPMELTAFRRRSRSINIASRWDSSNAATQLPRLN